MSRLCGLTEGEANGLDCLACLHGRERPEAASTSEGWPPCLQLTEALGYHPLTWSWRGHPLGVCWHFLFPGAQLQKDQANLAYLQFRSEETRRKNRAESGSGKNVYSVSATAGCSLF